MQVYAGKIRHGWPLIMRNIFTLLKRFNPHRARVTASPLKMGPLRDDYRRS